MLSVANTLRRTIGHKCITRLTKQTSGLVHYSNLTSKSTINLSYRISNVRPASLPQRLGPAVFGAQNVRAYSTNDESKKQDNEEALTDEEDGDERVSRLPAVFSVPEIWPRLPIITYRGSPIFPQFMKIFEVSLTYVHRAIA